MTNVQIAIQDRDYAEELRRLLVADGNHQVHLLEQPVQAMDGVVVVDENLAKRLPLSERYVVFMGRSEFRANELFEAGVRHVIHADCAPHLGRLIVLAAESRLNQHLADDRRALGGGSPAVKSNQPEPEEISLFDETDRSFLRALKISDR